MGNIISNLISVLIEFILGSGGGRSTAGTTFIPYGRMMFGYRFFRKNK
ncbi:MAG: hypothetical protein ACJAT4_001235 [Granulosicoccus sp.]|jgi:hypothetical protein